MGLFVNNRIYTFDLAELIDGLKAGGVVELVGVERSSEERSIGYDFSARQFVLRAAQSRHLAVGQVHVEVGKFDVIALRVRLTATSTNTVILLAL